MSRLCRWGRGLRCPSLSSALPEQCPGLYNVAGVNRHCVSHLKEPDGCRAGVLGVFKGRPAGGLETNAQDERAAQGGGVSPWM